MKKDTNSNITRLQYKWITKSQQGCKISPTLLQLLMLHFFKTLPQSTQMEGIKLTGLTEYCRQGTIFRCHPNYRNEGPWFDYVLIAWQSNIVNNKGNHKVDSDDDNMNSRIQQAIKSEPLALIPAKLICFVQDPEGEMFAIIHSCYEQKRKMSVLTYQWQLEYEEDNNQYQRHLSPYDLLDDTENLTSVYRNVSIDTLQQQCLMIPYHQNSRFLMEVIDQHKWATSFSLV
jgi:hypothetical protein